ncbi:unnamed protein product [Bursaphelenchus xylophilus]|uniref:[histone H3]-lysine(4) N-trimethyltransferase n=1 Tax=Bursaphelenchus xylophilus TaxID=6326 RepID=A0A1I7RWI1_BURXY|nr:unnamed protein product [Bursaphelenchus xylophilus]CAG9128397.1 unnamed protein product [Bursaphelenchus xylophilus]
MVIFVNKLLLDDYCASISVPIEEACPKYNFSLPLIGFLAQPDNSQTITSNKSLQHLEGIQGVFPSSHLMQSQLWPPGPSTSAPTTEPPPAISSIPTVVVDHFDRRRHSFEHPVGPDNSLTLPAPPSSVEIHQAPATPRNGGVYVLSQLNPHDVSNICVVENSADKTVYVQKCSPSQLQGGRAVVSAPDPNRRFHNAPTRTVVVNPSFYGQNPPPPRRVVVNSRLNPTPTQNQTPIRVEQITPAAQARAYTHASLGPLTQQRLRSVPLTQQANGAQLQAAQRRLSQSLEELNAGDYNPNQPIPTTTVSPATSASQSPAQSIRRPTTVVVTRTIRPTTLSYATSQRNALPVTVKLPSQNNLRVPRLTQTVREDRRIAVDRPMNAVLQSSSARVRPIDPKYKDKSNRAFVAFRKEQQQKFAAAVDKRKREFSHPPHHLQQRQPSGSVSSCNESKMSVSPKSEHESAASNGSIHGEYQFERNGLKEEEENSQEELKITENGDVEMKDASQHDLHYMDYGQAQELQNIQPMTPAIQYQHRQSQPPTIAGYDLTRYEMTGQFVDGQPVVKPRRPGRPRKTDPPIIRTPKDTKRRKLDDESASEKRRKQKPPKRTLEQEIKVADSYMLSGFDDEDLAFIRKQFEAQQMSNDIPWKQQIPWRDHTVPPRMKMIPQPARFDHKLGRPEPYFEDPDLWDVVPVASGCARAEPYRKVEDSNKIKAKRSQRMIDEILKDRALVHESTESRGFSKRREMARSDSQSGDSPDPYSHQANMTKKLRQKITKVSLSAIHGWGLFVMEPCAPGELIIEYVGEEIRTEVAETREIKYMEQGKLVYMFSYDRDWVIDATMMGNAARFINHSCRPNCTAETKMVDGVRRIYIYSKTWIDKGTELTYDYKFLTEDENSMMDCLCGEHKCRRSFPLKSGHQFPSSVSPQL